jgi:hypothetical protein
VRLGIEDPIDSTYRRAVFGIEAFVRSRSIHSIDGNQFEGQFAFVELGSSSIHPPMNVGGTDKFECWRTRPSSLRPQYVRIGFCGNYADLVALPSFLGSESNIPFLRLEYLFPLEMCIEMPV